MTINPIVHNTGGIFRFSDYISQIPDFLKAEPDAVTLLQVMSDYINNAYRNVTIVKKFKFKLIAVEHNVISVTNTLQRLADLFILAESHGTNMLFLSKVEDPTTSTPDITQDPFSEPPTPNRFFATPGGSTPRLIEFSVSNISEVRARKVKKIGASIFYEVFFSATIDNIIDSKSSFEIDVNDDGDATKNFLVNYYNFPIINIKNLEKMPYGFGIEFNGVRQGKAVSATLNTIVLDTNIDPDRPDASDIDNFYNEYLIKIVSGTGSNQIRTITNYIGLTKTATVSQNWTTIPDTSSIFITIAPRSSHMEWTEEIIYSKDDSCNTLIDINPLWEVVPLTIIDYSTIVIPIPPSGKYGSLSNSAHANTVLTYNSLTEYSADLSVYKASGTLSTLIDYPILSGICIGEINASLNTNILVGLSIQWDGVYFHITNSGVELFKEKINGLISGIYERKIKIKINNNSIGVYIDNNLQYTIYEGISTTKLGFLCIKNDITLIDFMYGFIDNIKIMGHDITINTLPDDPIPLLGKGLFYARDLTNLDKTTEFIDFNTGVNKYLDPLFYKSIPLSVKDLPSLQYNFLVDDINHSFLRIPFNNSTGTGLPFVIGDTISRLHTYLARYATTVINGNLSLSGAVIIDGFLPINGDRILVKNQTSPLDNGIYIYNNSGTWLKTLDVLTIEPHVFITEGLLNINKAFEFLIVDSIVSGVTEVPINQLIINNSIAKITEVSTNYLIVNGDYKGDWVSGGIFAKILNGEIVIPSLCLANINSVSKLWNAYTSTYTIGTKVTYNNIKYKVLVSHFPSPNETPENNHGLYSIYMFDDTIIPEPNNLITYKKILELNPYMFGMYQVRHIPINEEPDFDGEGFAGLYDDLYIQPAEELDIKFKTLQRDWLFNPRIASNTELRRNGWMEVLSQESSLYDIPTATSTNKLKDGTIIFSRQNLFDITANNPEIATILPNTEGWYKYTLNTLEFQKTASYDYKLFPLTRIKENNDELNVNMEVFGLNDEKDIQITTPTNIIITFDDVNVDTSTNELVLNSVAPSNFVGSKIFLNNPNPDNLPSGLHILTPYFVKEMDNTLLKIKISKEFNGPEILLVDGGIGTHTLTKTFVQIIPVKNGDVVNLTSQTTNPRENGRWRVINNGNWIRLSKKTALKISDIVVDFKVVDDLALSDDPVKYTVYTDVEVDNFINIPGGRIQDTYKIEKGFATNFRFILEHIDGIDTTKPFNLQYDARFDSNTIADVSTMSKSFRGVPDMGYPLVEKIERLVYQKDPSVIDLELLAYLARFMGYDISQVSDDISESGLYSTDKEREAALRRMIQNLPQYYALKATETGVESILLAFGIVGEIIKQWTSQDNPYEDFIPEDEIENRQRSAREQGIILNLVPTPHFFLRLNIDNVLENDYNSKEFERINANVISYKPINTVFSGIIVYLTRVLKQRISLSPLLGTVFFSSDIGYDIDFSEIDNGC